MTETTKPIVMSNLTYEGEFIRSWDFLGNDNWRLYFKQETCWPQCNAHCSKGHGFKFVVIEWVANPCNEELWDNNTEVQFLFNGIAMFDGIRHMWLNTDQDEIFGYVNYPNLDQLIEILREIRKLELMYCRDPHHD